MDKLDNNQTNEGRALRIMDKSFQAAFIVVKFAATVTYATFKIVFKTMVALSIIGGFNDNQHRR